MSISIHINGQIPTDPPGRVLAALTVIAVASQLTPEQIQTILGVLELLSWFRR